MSVFNRKFLIGEITPTKSTANTAIRRGSVTILNEKSRSDKSLIRLERSATTASRRISIVNAEIKLEKSLRKSDTNDFKDSDTVDTVTKNSGILTKKKKKVCFKENYVENINVESYKKYYFNTQEPNKRRTFVESCRCLII
jgi:hypothetical protein